MSLRVLSVASECVPLVKTGGLADVVGALPAALAAEGVRVTTLLPGYPAVMAAMGNGRALRRIDDLFGGPARLQRGEVAGMDIIAIDAPHLFARPGNPYLSPQGGEWADNGVRFAALGAVAALVATGGIRNLNFDLVHAHDWQAGLAPAYLRFAAKRVPSVFTVHNLAFQGKFPLALFPLLGLPPQALSVEGVEYFGTTGFLKAGLWYADRITTVSPTYAAEIRTPEMGMGLDGLLRGRAESVSGILNGIDEAAWDPSRDKLLPANFSATDVKPRAVNKAALQRRLGLEEDPEALLFGFVGRLTWQKGVDLILGALGTMLGQGAQLAILGTGDAELEHAARGAAWANPGRVGHEIGYDEALARQIYGGADVVLVPSRFEPCGLAQLCALRYGALPLVAHVGGLSDSVIDANEMALAEGQGTGVHFSPVSQEMLQAAVLRMAALWRDRPLFQKLQANALRCDVSWRRSASRYAALYRDAISHAA
ncbi:MULTISPECIES: glycogen synthase GlgA [Roseomonadaceae]|uniref:Glycogen synthase n=1 Tax=Falsiroseomonas oleicola TaxID=2801474 RepID=A0ABS6HB67_9PROT|nr:glycogen synthase GlgA [Roseomonas oleicola]MBU8545052.1 glycogen synthase GlgA [Roseomonas oleicola]